MSTHEKKSYSPQSAADAVDVSKSTIERAIKAGDLRAKKNGRRYLITSAALDAWLDGLEDA